MPSGNAHAADNQQWEWRGFDRSRRSDADAMDDLIDAGQLRHLPDTIDQQLQDMPDYSCRRLRQLLCLNVWDSADVC